MILLNSVGRIYHGGRVYVAQGTEADKLALTYLAALISEPIIVDNRVLIDYIHIFFRCITQQRILFVINVTYVFPKYKKKFVRFSNVIYVTGYLRKPVLSSRCTWLIEYSNDRMCKIISHVNKQMLLDVRN